MAKMPYQKNLEKYMNRIRIAEKFRDNRYRDKWARYYKMWRNVVDALKDENGKLITDRSNISIPYAFTQLETILPRQVETLFAGRPYVACQGRPKNAEEWRKFQAAKEKPWMIAAEKMENLLDYQQNIVFDIQDKFQTGLRIMDLYGTTVAFTCWKYREKKVIRKEAVPVHMTDQNGNQLQDLQGNPIPLGDYSQEQQGIVPVTELQNFTMNDVIYDDPDLIFLDLGLFFVDPQASDVDDARYAGHTSYETKEYLQMMHDLGEFYINWKKIPTGSEQQNMAQQFRDTAIGIPTTDGTSLSGDEEMELYKVHHYWEDDKYVAIINDQFIARDGDNPYWHQKKPYVKDVFTEDPGQFYGIGVIEMIEDLQQELNAERNQRIDYRSVSLRRMFTQRRDANITPANWEIKQYGKVLVDEHDDIKEWDFKSVGSDSFTQENVIKGDMQDATGAHDVVMGTSSGGETATTTMTKDNNASIRFKMNISSIEKRLLVGVSRLMVQMNQQFIDDQRLIEIQAPDGNQDFMEISPEEIQGEFRLIPAGSSVEPLANKEAHKQRMVELYSLAVRDPMLQQYPEKRRNLLKKLLESFNIKDIDNLLPTDEELQGQQQQKLLQTILSALPPQLAQMVIQSLQNAASPAQPTQPQSHEPIQSGGGANTAAQQEQGMQMAGVSG